MHAEHLAHPHHWLAYSVAVGIQQFGLFVVTGTCFHSLLPR
jgi:hypothetical protein